MTNRTLRLAAFTAGALTACAESAATTPADASEHADAQTTLDAGLDAAIDDAGSDAATALAPGFSILNACGAARPCGDSTAQIDDNGFTTGGDIDCALTQLQLGTPGLYVHRVSVKRQGHDYRYAQALLVHADGTLIYASGDYFDVASDSGAPDNPGAHHCRLNVPEFYQACRHALAASDHMGAVCSDAASWFAHCTQGPGQCEAPTDVEAGVPVTSDYDRLLACDVARPCKGRSFAQVAEFTLHVDTDTACVMEALRDGTPGLYMHETDHTSTSSSSSSRHAVIVNTDGSALYARTFSSSGPGTPRASGSGPTYRCHLKPSAFFDACVSEVQERRDTIELRDCTYNANGSNPWINWLEACVETAPACE